ncbi:MAG: hypothetical protein NXI19_20805 [Alphaproteobacteria bacterium]|nr:hypothetical protein [Alphaproteobacteria bacterium]
MTSNSKSNLKSNPYMTLKRQNTALEAFEKIVKCVGPEAAFYYIGEEWSIYEYLSVCSTPTASYLPWAKSIIFASASFSMKYWLDEAGIEHDYDHQESKLSFDDYIKFFYVSDKLGIESGLTYDRNHSSIDEDRNNVSQIEWDELTYDAAEADDLLDVKSYNSLPDLVPQIQSDFLDLARTIGGTAAIETMLERDNPAMWIWIIHFGPLSREMAPEFELFRAAYVTLKDHLKKRGIENHYFPPSTFEEIMQIRVMERQLNDSL